MTTTSQILTTTQHESLVLTLWAELHLPIRPTFTPQDRPYRFQSEVFTYDNGFMGKFVREYQVTLSVMAIEVDSVMGELFEAGVNVGVHYRHGRWMGGGSNGVSTSLYLDRLTGRWIDENTARELINDAWERRTSK